MAKRKRKKAKKSHKRKKKASHKKRKTPKWSASHRRAFKAAKRALINKFNRTA